ncbi:HD domain-containing protein [Candidatus Venteria ishoeyi]|uniref:GTP pyrophosphokinase rsh n=1 Tax=Candidatus Venteria ishoeyi TaxID=1899563 RepID=A0A1H6F7R4_9GAMM|nr:HD domain-containing protein [Candidatus Venteria ishoeyi]MDM8547631.1 HD domain-containing protein [Candidatus Venteria ishoeyi]SEH06160.1 GTP pyrophosphokinase rsh [Candidatus Venteria ishoeyi]
MNHSASNSVFPSCFMAADINLIMTALRFSAERHKDQRRKDVEASPYINHPIQVAEILWRIGEVHDITTLIAALLHDTLEDTETTADELEAHFGLEIRTVVEEVSDDKSLCAAERKRLQIEHAASISLQAKWVKLADKICNVYDITHNAPPRNWSQERKHAYLDWSDCVVAGLRGSNAKLEAYYAQIVNTGRERLKLSS